MATLQRLMRLMQAASHKVHFLVLSSSCFILMICLRTYSDLFWIDMLMIKWYRGADPSSWSFLWTHFNNFNGEKLAGHIQYFNNLVIFHHDWAALEFPSIMMNGCSLKEGLEHLLGLKLTPVLNWNSYKWFITKDAVKKMVASLYHSSKYLTHPAMLYIYKSQIRPYTSIFLMYIEISCVIYISWHFF